MDSLRVRHHLVEPAAPRDNAFDLVKYDEISLNETKHTVYRHGLQKIETEQNIQELSHAEAQA